MKEYTLDATDQTLGRLSSKVAHLVRGKGEAAYAPNVVPNVRVNIINASKVSFPMHRKSETIKRFSGHPGGLTQEAKGHYVTRRGMKALMELTIKGMLPRNTHRDILMKHITITL